MKMYNKKNADDVSFFCLNCVIVVVVFVSNQSSIYKVEKGLEFLFMKEWIETKRCTVICVQKIF